MIGLPVQDVFYAKITDWAVHKDGAAPLGLLKAQDLRSPRYRGSRRGAVVKSGALYTCWNHHIACKMISKTDTYDGSSVQAVLS